MAARKVLGKVGRRGLKGLENRTDLKKKKVPATRKPRLMISSKKLEEFGACEEQVELIEKLFGKAPFELTGNVVDIAAANGVNLLWFVREVQALKFRKEEEREAINWMGRDPDPLHGLSDEAREIIVEALYSAVYRDVLKRALRDRCSSCLSWIAWH